MVNVKLGAFEWFVLWGVCNAGGAVEVDELKLCLSGCSKLNKNQMDTDDYIEKYEKHKGIIRAINSLERKDLIATIRSNRKDLKYPRATGVLLTEQGFAEAEKWCLPGKPLITILGPNSPPQIDIYDNKHNITVTYSKTPLPETEEEEQEYLTEEGQWVSTKNPEPNQ